MKGSHLGLTERELCSKTLADGGFEPTKDSSCWFAATVKPQHELAVERGLSAKGVHAYAPVYWTARRWSDRVKRLRLPLFPGYVFCQFEASNRAPVLRTPGIRTLVSFGNEMAPIPDSQIGAIQQMLASSYPVEPCQYVRVGQRVQIGEGPLAGLEGILAHYRNSARVVVNVDVLQRSVAVEVDPGCLVPLN